MATRIKFAICLACVFSLFAFSIDQTFTKAQVKTIDFKRDIEPIFRTNCYACHAEKKAAAQLRLDSRASAMKGGINGTAIIPGKSKESRLVHRILGEGGEQQMPLGGEAWKQEEIKLIQMWIDQGAPWPDESAIRNPQSAIPQHWAFVAPKRPPIPDVKNKSWAQTPIDNFILAELERQGLEPSPEADKVTLIRRLYLDLLGLPPSPKDVDDFLADQSSDAY